MIAVAGHWEIGYMAPIMEAHLWNLILRDFGVTEWLMTPVSGVRHLEENRVNLKEFHTHDDLLASCEGTPRVFLEPRVEDAVWLPDFEHPENCVYVFGSAHFNPTIGYRRPEDTVVTVPTVLNSGVPWAHQILSIVLYDRMMK